MSDLVHRLGARLLGQAPTLAPRLTSRFESSAPEPHTIGASTTGGQPVPVRILRYTT